VGRIGVATLPPAQACRLPSGTGGREPSANRRRGQSRHVGAAVTVVAGAAPATAGNSVAGTAVVTSRLTPRPRGQPRAAKARCPLLEPYAGKLCAAERGAESLTQSGETRREVSGPSGSPEGESWRGKEHAREAGVTRRRLRCRLARPA